MKVLEISKGMQTLLDDDTYDWLSAWRWCPVMDRRGYTYVRRTSREEGTLLMHRLITGAQKGFVVDHINHNTLDNRRENLRLCTRSQNAQNAYGQRETSSKYKGVCFERRGLKRWRASMKLDQKSIFIGNFATEREAARAYNQRAKSTFGEFAKLNILEGD